MAPGEADALAPRGVEPGALRAGWLRRVAGGWVGERAGSPGVPALHACGARTGACTQELCTRARFLLVLLHTYMAK